MSYQTIIAERYGGVLALKLNRPQILNAASPLMFSELSHALSQLGDARCVLLSGEGRAFCAGADISGDGAPADISAGDHAYAALIEHYNPVILRLAELDVPVVSAVRGAVAGIGCSLALSADFCIASDTAYFLQAFVNIGLVCDGGASYVLPRLVGRARAMEMMLLGERLEAVKALEWGLIHRTIPDDMLDSSAMAAAQRLAGGPTLALGSIRKLIAQNADRDLQGALAAEASAQRIAANSQDAMEGVAAFCEKRSTEFKGL
jgi:2-(1,2-epoxy-1,2-dihydrophenyl)acetyl-CoA isomerase